jgi:hypothetical protein
MTSSNATRSGAIRRIPAVEQIDATRVACGVLHVDGKDSQVHQHPLRLGDINLPSVPQRAPAPGR